MGRKQFSAWVRAGILDGAPPGTEKHERRSRALCNVTLLRSVASRLLCGDDVSAGLSPDLKTLTPFRVLCAFAFADRSIFDLSSARVKFRNLQLAGGYDAYVVHSRFRISARPKVSLSKIEEASMQQEMESTISAEGGREGGREGRIIRICEQTSFNFGITG